MQMIFALADFKNRSSLCCHENGTMNGLRRKRRCYEKLLQVSQQFFFIHTC